MRSAAGLLVLASLILGGCEDGKPITPPPAEERPSAPSAAETPPAPVPTASPTPPPAQPSTHGATGVGDTAPAPERAPPKVVPPPAANAHEWGKREGQSPGDMPRGMELGSASDAGPR
jgi:hypothetical protein